MVAIGAYDARFDHSFDIWVSFEVIGQYFNLVFVSGVYVVKGSGYDGSEVFSTSAIGAAFGSVS